MVDGSARRVARARAALAGNPSDGYGGAVLAVTLEAFCAQASARPAGGLGVDPTSDLVEATVRRFARDFEPAALGAAVRWETSIPQGVGLGGSSAIVIAVLRALCLLYGVSIAPAPLAELALAVETEDLGIAAGLQDRVAQAYEGLTFMDFGSHDYEQLDPNLLPPLVVAWQNEAAQSSYQVHGSLRGRFEAGDGELAAAMTELAGLARAARAALIARDDEAFAGAVAGSFDVRERIMQLDRPHVEMIECARDAGAPANYTGSGGAIVAVCRDEQHRSAVRRALGELGCETLSVAAAE